MEGKGLYFIDQDLSNLADQAAAAEAEPVA